MIELGGIYTDFMFNLSKHLFDWESITRIYEHKLTRKKMLQFIARTFIVKLRGYLNLNAFKEITEIFPTFTLN